jgi:hypothetical protein
VVVAHSISSRVELDYGYGTAHKTYSPPRWVRVLYAAAFQSPFPYEANGHSLEAASHRRRIAGLLTEFWYGENLVSPTLDVHPERDLSIGFVTELVRGSAPTDNKNARRFLKTLTRHFLDAGLPTWQVTPHNPRAVGNLIQREDGAYRIIDLESNLVAPLMPVSGVVGAIRQGNFPAFDDIDLDKLNAYLATNQAEITASLGDHGFNELVEASAAYAESVRRWRMNERRYVSRAARFALKLVDVPSWIRGLKRMNANSQGMADRMVQQGIDTWAAEGHIDDAQATELRREADAPAVASALTHLGAHIAITIPLRFPFGSIARAAWTVSMRAKAEWDAIVRRKPIGSAREEHTLLVAAVSAVPTFGAAAYMLAKPLRANRALAVIAFDRSMRKLPWKLYDRMHLSPFMVWHAKVVQPEVMAPRTWRSLLSAARVRIGALREHAWLIGGVLAANMTVITIGGVLYVAQDTRVVFNEKGVMNTTDAAQLALAGVLGLAAYATFWKGRDAVASVQEAAGIMFWGIAGAGLMFLAADDYFGLHERMGDWMAQHSYMIPMYTNTADDIITLGVGITGLSVLYVFRHELIANRASSVLMIAGALAAFVMVGADVYGRGIVRPLEFPAQVSASGLLFLAFFMRFREVRAAVPAPVARTERVGGAGVMAIAAQ